jgi:hypothetical protein
MILKRIKDMNFSEELNVNFTEVNVGETTRIIIESVPSENVSNMLKEFYDYQNTLENVNVMIDLKKLPLESLIEAFKYSFTREDLKDPLMILNILNLIKIYITLDDSFFNDESIYLNSIEELLDVKLSLHNELKEFIKKLSIYFISLFKSYNKISYTPLDNHIELPSIYRAIILSCDLLTLSGIFSISEPFDISECVYIDNSIKYIQHLMLKNSIGAYIIDEFFKGREDANSTE